MTMTKARAPKKSNHQAEAEALMAARMAALSTWDDRARDDDWTKVCSEGRDPDAVADLKPVLSFEDLVDAFEMPKSRWRKTLERIRRQEQAKSVRIWPTEAPADISAAPLILKWMMMSPARFLAYDALYQHEFGEGVFDRVGRTTPYGATLTPLVKVATCLAVFGSAKAADVNGACETDVALAADPDPKTRAKAEVASILRSWIAKHLPGFAQQGLAFPLAPHAGEEAPKKKRGRPSKADLAARALLAEASQPQGDDAKIAPAPPAPSREADLSPEPTAEAAVAAEAADDTIVAAGPDAAETRDLPLIAAEVAPVTGEDDLELLEAQAKAAQDLADALAARLKAARLPLATEPLRSELDGHWPENGITWQPALPRIHFPPVANAHRQAILATTALASVNLRIASTGARLSEDPGSLEAVIAELSQAREERAKLIAERNDAAEAIQEVVTRHGTEWPVEAPAITSDPKDAEIDRLTQRIAELEAEVAVSAPVASKTEAPQEHHDASGRKHSVRHVIATISLTGDQGTGDKRRRAIGILTEWSATVAKTSKDKIDEIATRGTIVAGDHEIRIAKSADGSLWAIRHTHPDAQLPQRTWTVEATVVSKDGALSIFAQVILTGRDEEKYSRSRPRFIKGLVDLGGWSDGSHPVTGQVKAIDDIAGFDAIAFDPARRLPLVVISLTNATNKPVVDVTDVAKRLYGVAHVAAISHEAGRSITRVHGPKWSTYDGAVRIYQPIPDRSASEPSHHGYLPANKIRSSEKAKVAEALLGHALAISALTSHSGEAIDFSGVEQALVNSIQDNVLSKPKDEQTGNELRELAAMREKQVEDRDVEIKTLHELLTEESSSRLEILAERNALIEASEQLKLDNLELEAQAESMRSHLARIADKRAPIPVTPAEVKTHAQLLEYLQTSLDPRIAITPRAMRDLRKKSHVNVPVLMDGIALLKSYADLKGGSLDYQVWMRIRSESRLTDCSYSKDTGQLEAYGDYCFSYMGKDYVAERHLKWGNDPDIRKTVRIYYTYDEASHQVIVCSLTDHFTVKSTN